MPETPNIAVAKPVDKRTAWQVYLGGKIAVRERTNGTVEYKVDDGDWKAAD